MAKSKKTIISEIKEFMKKWGGNYSDWYVGIASDPRKRLFTEHNVDEKKDAWIYRKCDNSDIAREIEEYFVEILGTDGGAGGGDETTKYVYAYKKAPHTNG